MGLLTSGYSTKRDSPTGEQEGRLAFLWADITSGKLLPSGESAHKRQSYESDHPIAWMEENVLLLPADSL